MKKFKSWLLAGIVMSIVSMVVSFVVNLLFAYDVFALPGIRPITDPLLIAFFAYPFLLSAIMVFAWDRVHSLFHKGHAREKAFEFGVFVWLFAGFLNTFLVLTSMDYPLGFFVDSFAGTLLSTIAGAYVIVREGLK